MRTAIWLLALLAAFAIPGSVLPQRNVSTDPGAVPRFYQDNPTLAPWLDRLSMFDVYGSPWFAATYLLLFVSMTGCVVPRSIKLWRTARAEPEPAPRHLLRMTEYRSWRAPRKDQHAILVAAQRELRQRGFRVARGDTWVSAERGHLRELGNLVFHLSLLVLLVGIGIGRFFGYEGRVVVVEGESMSNLLSQYDEFNARPLTRTDQLEPFELTLQSFAVRYETSPDRRGEPRQFDATVQYTASPKSPQRSKVISPNHPLNINETKVFLTGHGYAPRVTMRDTKGNVTFSGPVVFFPTDGSYSSDGVIKVPDATPQAVAFEGFFLPTAVDGPDGPYSAFPGLVNPELFLTAYTGDLGLSTGIPQSVYTLDKSGLKQVTESGKPFSKALQVGATMQLPDGLGSLTFDGVALFANFQIAYDPGKEISLVAAVLLLIGLTSSLTIRRRTIWVRVSDSSDASHTVVELATQSQTRRSLPGGELHDIAVALGLTPPDQPTPTGDSHA